MNWRKRFFREILSQVLAFSEIHEQFRQVTYSEVEEVISKEGEVMILIDEGKSNFKKKMKERNNFEKNRSMKEKGFYVFQ